MRALCYHLLLVMLSFSAIAEDDLEGCQSIRIGGAANYTPVSYVLGNQLTGVGPELAAELAKDIGRPHTTMHAPSWARTLRRHEEGHIDMLAGLYRTKSREEHMIFIGPFMQEKTLLVIRRDQPITYRHWEDLKPYRGVSVIDDSHGDTFDKFARTDLAMIFVHSQEVAFKMLLAARVDYLVVGQNTPLRERIGDSDIVLVHPKPIASQGIYMTVSRKSPCAPLAGDLGQALEKALVGGRAVALSDRFTSTGAP